MTETVVHVTTLEQWKSVLDVWFKQGYEWFSSGNVYAEKLFEQNSANQLGLVDYGFKYIVCWINNDYDGDNLIEYKQFMEEQQKEDNKMETYYVTQEQLDLIKDLKNESINKLDYLLLNSNQAREIFNGLHVKESNVLLRYLGGDETVEFKVKEQLYRLWRIDDNGDRVYMHFLHGTPSWTTINKNAFTAPLEEIKKWKTISWEIEEVK